VSMSTFQLTALGVGIVLAACGVARAQPAYPAAPSYYTPPSPVAAYGQGLSPTDAQGLLMALTAARSGDSARVREAMAGLSDPLAGKIALWALADTAPDSLGEQETASVANLPAGWPRLDRRQIAAQRLPLVQALDEEFATGWTALTRFNNAKIADDHFARLQQMSQAPLTQSRALYWRGRAADAMGDGLAAQLFYSQAAEYPTTFYGQLAATKTANPVMSLGHDPQITAADRAVFEGLEPVRAARLLVHPARSRLSAEDHAQPLRRAGDGVRAGHRASGEQLRPDGAFRRGGARHDAADAGDGAGGGQPPGRRIRRSI
jgi:hypothetical protein